MDWERDSKIYFDFIEDRLSKEHLLTVFELHHVYPRSKGGGNDSSNIIKLSHSDHLFAHVLLAKIFGGKMCAALQLMLDDAKYSGRRSRLRYEWARREAAEISRERARGNTYASNISDEVRESKRRLMFSNWRNPEWAAHTRKRSSEANVGNTYRLGKRQPEKACAVIAQQQTVRWQDQEYAASQSAAQRAGWASKEDRAQSEEHKENNRRSWTAKRRSAAAEYARDLQDYRRFLRNCRAAVGARVGAP